VVEIRAGNAQAGTAHLEKAVRLLEDAFHEHPADVSVRQDLSDASAALASARASAGDCPGAEDLVARATALWRELEKTAGAGAYALKQSSAIAASHPPCTAARGRITGPAASAR
jgi:hypothetical protein